MEWHQAINQLKPYVVRIATPQGSGTGWLVSRSNTTKLCGIATAAHVIDHAHYWEEPIRIYHPASQKAVVLRHTDRAVHIDADLDSAGIVFPLTEMDLPMEVPTLVEKDKYIKPGVEIGWLGFPALPRADLCFFSGRISAYIDEMSAYLVDGVAINGVSGGPAFYIKTKEDRLELMGIISAYIPNRATGEVLPGVAVVRDTTQFHDIAGRFSSFDEAKRKESPPTEPTPSPEPSGSDAHTKTSR